MATKSKRSRRRSRSGAPPNTNAPKVHAKVVAGDIDINATTRLVAPALLYADRVTLYSPATTLIAAFREIGAATTDVQRLTLMKRLADRVPSFAARLPERSPETWRGLVTVLEMPPPVLRGMLRRSGEADKYDDFISIRTDLRSVWAELEDAVASEVEALEASELLLAIERGEVDLGCLTSATPLDIMGEVLAAAAGDTTVNADEMFSAFLDKLVQTLLEPKTFPLLDADALGLARAYEREHSTGFDSRALLHSAELQSAAKFVSYLPTFPQMPLDEVLDLRRELRVPLASFRATLGRLSREYESAAHEEGFEAEVEDAWRVQVEPALAELREAFAEHRLLRAMASVAASDPRRLMIEAGGVLVASHAQMTSLSRAVTVGLAGAAPLIDLTGRAALEAHRSAAEARSHGFCFLHYVDTSTAGRR